MNATAEKQRRVFFVSVFTADTKGQMAKAAVLRTGTWRYKGDLLKVTLPMLRKVVANFTRFNRTDEIPLDYEHGTSDSPLRGKDTDERRAAGWLQRLEVEDRGGGKAILWGFFRMVGDGLRYVKKGEYRFCSIEMEEDYVHPEVGEPIGPYLQAVALTNRPYLEQLPGMVLLSKRATQLMEAGEERAARGSDSPQVGARAERVEVEPVKINLSQYGGPVEGTEEDVGRILASQQTALTEAKASAQAAADKAVKAEADAKLLTAKVGAAESDKKLLTDRIASLEQKDRERDFERIFSAAKSDPQGARATEAEREFLKKTYLTYAASEGGVEEFEKWMQGRPRVLATKPASGGSGGEKKAPTSVTAKFLTAANARAVERKITFTEAAEQIAEEQPELHAAYRKENQVGDLDRRGGGGVPLLPGEEVV